jgi:hypothetical protein
MVFLEKNHNIQVGNITQYLILEGFGVVVQDTLMVGAYVPSMTEPTNGVWMRMLHHFQVQPLENLC